MEGATVKQPVSNQTGQKLGSLPFITGASCFIAGRSGGFVAVPSGKREAVMEWTQCAGRTPELKRFLAEAEVDGTRTGSDRESGPGTSAGLLWS